MNYAYESNPRGHVWKRNEDGSIDIFAYEGHRCNGPACINCGYSFCHHCTDYEAEEDCTKPALEGECFAVVEPLALGKGASGG